MLNKNYCMIGKILEQLRMYVINVIGRWMCQDKKHLLLIKMYYKNSLMKFTMTLIKIPNLEFIINFRWSFLNLLIICVLIVEPNGIKMEAEACGCIFLISFIMRHLKLKCGILNSNYLLSDNQY